MGGDLLAVTLATATARLGDEATAVLLRLGGALGGSVRNAALQLANLDEPTRKLQRAQAAALARTPSLGAVRGVHPTWIEAALAELPARARTAIGGESHEPIDIWLARWALAALPPMPPTGPAELVAMLAREPAQIAGWLASIALDQLAFALGAVPDSAPAPLRAAAARIVRAPRHGALGSQRATARRCRGFLLDDASSLLALASRALAPHLALQPLSALQLTRRLPYDQGNIVEAELIAGAETALADVPAWAALFAG